MDCHIGVYENGKWRKMPVRALWDTGTSVTVITPRVAETLNLPKLDGKFTLNAVNNQSEAQLCVARVILPNNKAYGPIAVAVQNLPSVDVLLGMDVISSGTFTIERKPDGGTRFTFVLNL